MSEEKDKVVWVKRWGISFFIMILALITNFIIFETEVIETAPLFPEYLTVYGFCFLPIYGAWLAFSAWCIYQIGKPNAEEPIELEGDK